MVVGSNLQIAGLKSQEMGVHVKIMTLLQIPPQIHVIDWRHL